MMTMTTTSRCKSNSNRLSRHQNMLGTITMSQLSLWPCPHIQSLTHKPNKKCNTRSLAHSLTHNLASSGGGGGWLKATNNEKFRFIRQRQEKKWQQNKLEEKNGERERELQCCSRDRAALILLLSCCLLLVAWTHRTYNATAATTSLVEMKSNILLYKIK